MKEQLTIEHLAPYLPYRLNCHAMGEYTAETECTDNPKCKEFTLVGIVNNKVSVSHEGCKELFHIDDIFPILRLIRRIRE